MIINQNYLTRLFLGLKIGHHVEKPILSAKLEQQERAYSGLQVSPAWRLDREMRRRLILQET